MEKINNRRKHKRYTAKEGFFAGAYPNVGQIVNISLGGLAYNYLGMVGEENDEGGLVLCGDDCTCLDDLAYNTLSDTVIANETSFSKFVTRQRRLQFVDLSAKQIEILESIMLTNISEDAGTSSLYVN